MYGEGAKVQGRKNRAGAKRLGKERVVQTWKRRGEEKHADTKRFGKE